MIDPDSFAEELKNPELQTAMLATLGSRLIKPELRQMGFPSRENSML